MRVRTVFGGSGHIVGEHYYSWPLERSSGQHLRVDRGAIAGREDSDPAVALFKLALATARRRDALQEQTWVVAVVRSSCGPGMREIATDMFAQVPRLLVIACETPEPAYVETCSTPGWLPFEAALAPFPLARDPLWHEIECGDEPAELVTLLEKVKRSDRAVLVRLRFNPQVEHGQDPDHLNTGTSPRRTAFGARPLAGTQVAADCLLRRMETDPTVVLVDFTEQTSWGRLPQRFPDRYFRAAEADANLFRWCADLADTGHRLVLFMTTSVLAQYHRDIARRLFRPECETCLLLEFDRSTDRTVLRGMPAAPQQPTLDRKSRKDEFSSGEFLNGLTTGTIMVPSSAPVLEQMLGHAFNHPGPCLLALSKHDYAPAELPARPVFMGKADLLTDGSAVVLLAVGQAVAPRLAAARELTVEGISTAVIDVRFLRPLDGRTLLASLEPAQAVVLLDDPSTPSGFVDLLLEFYEAHRLTPPLLFMPAPLASGHQRTFTREIVERCQQFLEVVHARAESLPGTASNWDHVAEMPGLDLGHPEDAVQRVLSRRLSDELSLWATVYEGIGNRDEYLWKWCREGVELTTLPCVAPCWLDHGGDTKVLSIILCVLLDDIADKHGSLGFLETLIEIVEHGRFQNRSALGPDERRYAETTSRLSEIYRRRLQEYPRFEAFQELLQYDLIQFSNTLRYSHLLNRQLSLMNMAEHDLYLPHNMHMMSFATIDLMCSPDFQVEDLGQLREAVWHGQCMGRIGNLLSTWRREIAHARFHQRRFRPGRGRGRPDDRRFARWRPP